MRWARARFADMPLPVFNDLVFLRKKHRTRATEHLVASLFIAAEENDVDSLNVLLHEKNLDADTENVDLQTALQVEPLGLDTSRLTLSRPQVAASLGHREACEVLLEAGADRMHVDAQGVTPIDAARGNNFKSLARVRVSFVVTTPLKDTAHSHTLSVYRAL